MSLRLLTYNLHPESLRLQEDIQHLSAAGFKAYRFSISWSRVLPAGGRSVNEKGVDYYNSLINDLTSAGIMPAATLYHWDLPEALHESYGGWLNATIVDDFAYFARVCFENFGDRVPIWMTLNEPGQTAVQGYGTGNFAPRRCSDRTLCAAGDSSTEPYLVCARLTARLQAALPSAKRPACTLRRVSTTPEPTSVCLLLRSFAGRSSSTPRSRRRCGDLSQRIPRQA